jgi:hypothetical protein
MGAVRLVSALVAMVTCVAAACCSLFVVFVTLAVRGLVRINRWYLEASDRVSRTAAIG